MATYSKERTLEETSTWAVAVVCFVLLAISIFIEHFIHIVEKFLKKKRKVALVEAVEKVKAELMLLGFISLMLTILQTPISNICVSRKIAVSWLPCDKPFKKEETVTEKLGRRLFEFFDDGSSIGDDFPARRSLATKGYDSCTGKGKYAFVTAYGIHQLHIFIFVLAIMHVIYCITTLALGNIKMRSWKQWEKETKTLEYTYHNDPQRFRYARDTSFGRRHLHFWSRSTILLWIVSFFRQFFRSVTKVDYLALRHGFIAAHLPPGAETRFDFQKYIHRSLEEDFKVIVGISPVIWLAAVLFLLTNTHGWYSYMWLPFASLVIILLVGTKLQVIITRLGLRIQERGNVVKGTPVVQPGDELFWFGKPRFLLFVIHFVLFQNAFQMAFFAWSTYSFGFKNCFHPDLDDIIIRVAMGVFIQVLCSYVTLPLYALVTQMGSTMKATVFNDQVATALKQWHHTAKKHTKHNKHTGDASSHMSASSRPMTPLHGTSPLHLLQNQKAASHEISPHASPSPRGSNLDDVNWEDIDLQFRRHDDEDVEEEVTEPEEFIVQRHPEPNSVQHANGEEAIDISLSNYSVQK